MVGSGAAWPVLDGRLDGARLVGSRLRTAEGVLAEPHRNARQRHIFRAGVLLEIWDTEGRTGIGEAAPLPGHSQESLQDCIAALDGITQRIADYDENGWPRLPWLDGVPAARFAWESALCDLLARRRGVALSMFVGGRSLPAVARNAVVEHLAQAEQAFLRGIFTLKVKIGAALGKEEPAERQFLTSLRQEFGGQFALRLDANGVFGLKQARERLQLYREFQPEFVEQPTGRQALARLGRCAVPWAADESLLGATPAQIAALLRTEGGVAWVLKPAALGLRRARELALLAQDRGLGVVITHLLDGPIGLAAACELALSLPQPPLACGLDLHPGLPIWPAIALPHHLSSAASIAESGHPGLGFAREGVPWS